MAFRAISSSCGGKKNGVKEERGRDIAPPMGGRVVDCCESGRPRTRAHSWISVILPFSLTYFYMYMLPTFTDDPKLVIR